MNRRGTIPVLALLVFSFVFEAHAARPKEKEWAFLIFLNGHNNLAEYGDLNLNQLEKIGSTDDIDVIVQWAKLGFTNTYRLKVEKDNDFNKVTSPIVETLPRQDMGDYRALVEFVRWSAEKYPAKHYFVSFWDHGSGWHRRGNETRGVSHDDYSGNFITTAQMGIAMREITAIVGHKVEIVGADACLMGMAEVGSEMVDGADWFVASEETEPALGWPYDTFFARWAAKPSASPAEITTYLVEEYHKSLSPTMEVTLSSFHLGALPRLWELIKVFGSSLLQLSDTDLLALRKETQSAVSFAYKDYVDLGNWLHKAMSHAVPATVDKQLIQTIRQTVTNMVAANKVTAKYADAEGIAFWVPPTKGTQQHYEEAYSKLRFDRETGWGKVVKRLTDLPVCARAVDGQWANLVLGFSSQYGVSQWSAAQATGACDTDGYGDHPTSWTPSTNNGGAEFISVAFDKPVYATGAVIRETLGNGFVTKVEAIDTQGNAREVWHGIDTSAVGAIADFEVTWARTDYLVKGLKITVDTAHQSGVWKEIDSVQLIGKP